MGASVPGVWRRFSTSRTPWIFRVRSTRASIRSCDGSWPRSWTIPSCAFTLTAPLTSCSSRNSSLSTLSLSVASSYCFGRACETMPRSRPSMTRPRLVKKSHAARPAAAVTGKSFRIVTPWSLSRPTYRRPRGVETLSCRQAQFQHVRLVEPVDPQDRACGGRGRSRRHQPDELGADDLGTVGGRLGLDPGHDLVQCRRLPVLDVHRDLDDAGARQVEPERTDAEEAAAGLAHHRGDRLRILERAPEVDVEGDQRSARADDDSARPLVEPLRAEVRLELARVDPPLQLLRAAAPEEGGAPAGCELAVEEHGEPDVDADPARQLRCRL